MSTELPTTESVRLMLSPRLMLTPTLDMPDTTDIPMPTELPTTERDLLMLSLRPMLTLTFCMGDMDMDTLDTVDTTDTHMVDMPTTDKLYQSHILLQKIDKTAINVFFFSDNIFQCLDSVLGRTAGNKENQNMKKSIMKYILH